MKTNVPSNQRENLLHLIRQRNRCGVCSVMTGCLHRLYLRIFWVYLLSIFRVIFVRVQRKYLIC